MSVISLFTSLSALLNQETVLSAITQNRFWLIFFVLVLSYLKHSTYKSIYLAALINIPGTILHELAHFLVGLFLYAKPTTFSLLPKKSGDSYITGSVGFRNIAFYNALPSAMAPLLLLIVGYYFNIWYFKNINLTFENYVIYIMLQTIIIENSIPSATDFRVGFGNFGSVVFYAFLLLVFGSWYFFG